MSERLRFLTAGESHGRALVAVLEGMPAGLPLDEEYIARDLARRQGGYGRGGRMQIERDRAEILSGVRHGFTLGSPISLLIWNRDWPNWEERMSVAPVDAPVDKVTRLRPGHADLAGAIKYGHDDVRNVLERASARETATRVAAGAVARRLLDEFGVEIHSHTVAIATVEVPESDPGQIDWAAVEDSPVRCADRVSAVGMRILIDAAQAEGDTLGGVFEVVASGLPIGLGSHVHWDRRLDGRLAAALMSIPSAKGVGIGAGFAAARQPGSEVHDVVVGREVGPAGVRYRHRTNRAGGVEGGMTNGEPVVARVALKPIPTLANPLPSLDLHTGETVQAHYERSDVCVVPAAGVVGEAMLALVLAEAWLEKFGGDSLEEVRRNYLGYVGI